MKHLEADPQRGIDSDHYPLRAELIINLKTRYKEAPNPPQELLKCTEEQNKKYNEAFRESMEQSAEHEARYDKIIRSMHNGSEENIPRRQKYKRKDHLTKEATHIINERLQAWKDYEWDNANILTKEIKLQMRTDRRQRILGMVSKDLDIRDRWMGLRYMKKRLSASPL